MYKAARTIAAEGTTITKGFHKLRRIPRRLVPHCGNLNPTYVSSGCAPWQGGAFLWVQVPPGNAPAGSSRSSYGGDEIAEAFGMRVTNW